MKTENRKRALEALCDEKNRTYTQAAEAAGLSRKTLWNFIARDATFAAEYQRACQQAAVDRAEALAEKRAEALEILTNIMADEEQPGALRIRAASTLLAEAAAAEEHADNIAKSLTFSATWG